MARIEGEEEGEDFVHGTPESLREQHQSDENWHRILIRKAEGSEEGRGRLDERESEEEDKSINL